MDQSRQHLALALRQTPVEQRTRTWPTHAPERGIVVDRFGGRVVRLVHAAVAAVAGAVLPEMGEPIPPRDDPRASDLLTRRQAGAIQALRNFGGDVDRLESQGFVKAEWGETELGRPGRFYRLTSTGRKRLKAESARWREHARAVDTILEARRG